MLKVKKVLIPTDFSSGAEAALARGADLARQFDAEIHLLHVALLAEATSIYPLFSLQAETEALVQQLDEDSRERLAGMLPEAKRVTRVLRHAAAPAPAIVEYAAEQEIDLITMGTHGRRGVRHFLLGSVAAEVVRLAKCPVATFRPEPVTAKRPRRILAAIDFSEQSPTVLAHARALGALYHAQVDLLHVVPQPHLPVFYEVAGGTEIYANFNALRDKALAALHDLVREPGDDAEISCHVEHGLPAAEILRFSQQQESDMIVVATHGLTGASHVLLGSVAEKVLHQAECPVLTVRVTGKSLVRNVA